MDTGTRKILAVGAHPDDVEFMCSGTLFLLRRLGYEVHVATLGNGDCGTAEHSREEISRIRRREAVSACQVLGAVHHCADLSDLTIFNDDATNRRTTALLRGIDPWMVLTHPPADYLADHETTSLLVRNACFYGPVRNYDTSSFGPAPATSRIPYLFYAQPLGGADMFGRRVIPEFYVDISDCLEQKEMMLASHESQRAWLRAHHGVDEYLDSMRRWSQELGREASRAAGRPMACAEAFRQHRGHAYPEDNILAHLLPDRVILEPRYQ